MCNIDATPPFGNNLSGQAFAQKAGEASNLLFALHGITSAATRTMIH